jgi:hypothetical protein
MAISIDTVYQRVLALANKEQRGYITPQEFNLLAGKAQLDIFNQYFHDYKTALLSPGSQSKTSDDIDTIREKIAMHRVVGGSISAEGTIGIASGQIHWLENVYSKPQSHRVVKITFGDGGDITDESSKVRLRSYRGSIGALAEMEFDFIFNTGADTINNSLQDDVVIGVLGTDTSTQIAQKFTYAVNNYSPYHSATSSNNIVTVTYTQIYNWAVDEALANITNTSISDPTSSGLTNYITYEEIDKSDWAYVMGSSKLKPLASMPTYYRKNALSIVLYPTPSAAILCDYIIKPGLPKWGYNVVGNKALYNSSTSINFVIHNSEESNLTNKILELAGIVINKPGLSEVILRNQAVKEAKENR